MITVGYSTRKSNLEYKEILQKTCMYKDIEIIEKVNNGEKSLSQVYNEILEESTNNIVVLCHDDLEFDTKRWGEKILKIFEKNPEYGIVGLAGTTVMPKSGMWWEDRSKMYGIVNHKNEGKKWESKYSNSLGEELKKVVVVDGLFLAINKNKIKENFDVNVPGFHMYDINFCFNNFLKDVKIGVTTQIRVTHLSIGMTNEQWEVNRQSFAKKNENFLPKKVLLDKNDVINLLLIVENSSMNNKLVELCKNLEEKFNIDFVYDKIDKETKSYLKKRKINTYNYKELPGIKIGDGKWKLNINGKTIDSTIGELYNTNNLSYDLIISDSESVLSVLKTVFPNSKKVLLTNNKRKSNSYVNYYKLDEIKGINDFILNELNYIHNVKDKIKIVSGYSDKGGSTTAFINLTNYLNNSGLDCTFYGPNQWHLDKCQSDLLKNLKFEQDDSVIFHYINIPNRPNVKKSIFSCHEKWWWSFKKINKFWDTCVFLHEEHRKFHYDYDGDYVIIPNFKENLLPKDKSDLDKVAGIIGSVEDRKQTHVSINRALEDGCEKILIFGQHRNDEYFNTFVKPLLSDTRIQIMGHSNNKQEMYDSIGRVYHSSKGEVACLVKDECYLTNTKFFGNEETNNEVSKLTNEEILELWKKTLI